MAEAMIGSRCSMAVLGRPLSIAALTFFHCASRDPGCSFGSGTAQVSKGNIRNATLRMATRRFIGLSPCVDAPHRVPLPAAAGWQNGLRAHRPPYLLPNIKDE